MKHIKIYLIILISIFILFFLLNPVNASFDFVNSNDIEYSFPDLPEDSEEFNSECFFIGTYQGNTIIYTFIPNSGFSSSDIKVCMDTRTWFFENCYCRGYTLTNNSWVYDSWQPGYAVTVKFYGSYVIYGSSFNIYKYNSSIINSTELHYSADIKNSTSSLPLIEFNIDNVYVTSAMEIKTQFYESNIIDNYIVKINFNDIWHDMFLRSDGCFTYLVTQNGSYILAYFDKFTGEQVAGAPVSTLQVTNIVGTGSNVNLSGDVVSPIFDVSYTGTDDGSLKQATIKTQHFTYEDIKNLEYHYATSLDSAEHLSDLKSWFTTSFSKENISGTDYYYFSFDVIENCTFFGVFYDYNKANFGYISYYDIDLDSLYASYIQEHDTPSLLELILKSLNFLNPFSSDFFGYKLVSLLLDGFGNLLKWLFVPSEDYFSNIQETLLSDLKTKLPYESYINMFGSILDISIDGQLEDISINNYQIGNKKINVPSFIDFSIITKYRDTWYTWVRGFVFIFLIIYHINQLTKFLRGFSITDGSLTKAGFGGDSK